MTCTLEEFCRLYVREIVRQHGVPVYRIKQGPEVYGTLLEEFPKGYGGTIDDEHCISSVDRWSVGGDHTGFRGHATSMCPRS